MASFGESSLMQTHGCHPHTGCWGTATDFPKHLRTLDLAELSPVLARCGLDPPHRAAAEPEHRGECPAQEPKGQMQVRNPGLSDSKACPCPA